MNWAKLHKDVAFGKSGGQIIWQPIISCWHRDKMFAEGALPAPWTGMTVSQIHRRLGVSMRPYAYGSCFRYREDPRVTFVKRTLNETDEETVIQTPVGRQVQVRRKSPNNWHHISLKWEVETEEELKIATWRRENATWEWDQVKFDQLQKEIGDLGAPTMYMLRMNVQSLYIEKMGTERGILAIYDWPDTVEAYFRATEEEHNRLIDVINKSPLEIICFGENVHAGTLSPDLFLRYHLPACQRRCERLRAAGKFVVSHWDGDVKPLLKYAKETGLDGIEAITPAPQGDVTIAEIHAALGDRMFLQDGIPAVFFDQTFPVKTLEDCTRELIERFAPRLILGISDEISSAGDLDRIRVVKEIVDEYNGSVSKL
jgi:hypothetical protein